MSLERLRRVVEAAEEFKVGDTVEFIKDRHGSTWKNTPEGEKATVVGIRPGSGSYRDTMYYDLQPFGLKGRMGWKRKKSV